MPYKTSFSPHLAAWPLISFSLLTAEVDRGDSGEPSTVQVTRNFLRILQRESERASITGNVRAISEDVEPLGRFAYLQLGT